MTILFSLAAFFPYGTPYTSRALNLCRTLRNLGHNVVVFCDYFSPEAESIEIGISQFENIEIHYSFYDRNLESKVLKSKKTITNIGHYLNNNRVDLIISSQSSDRFTKVLNLAKQYDIPLIIELCEKYHHSNWRFGRFDFRYIQFKNCWNKYYENADGFIVISKYLYEHFYKFSKPIIRIPTIMDTKEFLPIYESRDYSTDMVSFIFSGGLGNGKDKVIEWLEAVQNVNSIHSKFEVNIYGPSRADIESQKKQMKSTVPLNDPRIVIHGRIPQKDVPKEIAKNNFGLILRPLRESSNAGFPTKIAEYLAAGTPVISNRTSDIPDYISDGNNGFLVDNLERGTLDSLLRRISQIDTEEYVSMSKEARKTAENYFDYRKYKNIFGKLLMQVVDKKYMEEN